MSLSFKDGLMYHSKVSKDPEVEKLRQILLADKYLPDDFTMKRFKKYTDKWPGTMKVWSSYRRWYQTAQHKPVIERFGRALYSNGR